MKIEDILIAYLTNKIGEEITYHKLEQELPVFGKLLCGKVHNGSTYGRAFRNLKKKNTLPFVIKQIDYKKWRIV